MSELHLCFAKLFLSIDCP